LTAGVRDDSRREHVINAACEVFARHGYQKASMQDIAQAAGVSKSVLFKYFETKENLYRTVFRMASDGVDRADKEARAQGDATENVFALMRRMVGARMDLFSRLPWVYSFSYTAAYDSDSFVQSLVLEEYARRGIGSERYPAYRGIRRDIPNEAAQKLIRWISEGFLEEKLKTGDTDPEKLKREYTDWIDIMEYLLKEEGK
jgi:TetR/AcrR family transcriptional regulator